MLKGRAAAPPAIACSVGPSISQKPRWPSVSRIDLHDRRAIQKSLQHAFAVDQVQVPHPLSQFRVGQAMVFLGGRLQGFAQEMQGIGEDRQLTGARAAQLAIDTNQVPQVDAVGQLPPAFAHLLLTDEQLDLTGLVAQIQEFQFARVAQQDDTAGRTHPGTGHFPFALFGQPGAEVEPRGGFRVGELNGVPGGSLEADFRRFAANLPNRQPLVEAAPPRVDPELCDALQLVAA